MGGTLRNGDMVLRVGLTLEVTENLVSLFSTFSGGVKDRIQE
jgi:hypothetical protein